MSVIIKNYGNLYVFDESCLNVDSAKDELINRLNFARNKSTFGYRQGWKKLIDMYLAQEYDDMISYISSLTGYGDITRKKCLKLLYKISKANHIDKMRKRGILNDKRRID